MPDRTASSGSRLGSLIRPERKIGKEPSYTASCLAIAKASWLNVLLVFIPVSWALHFVSSVSDTVVFVMSFLAIIPLAKLLGFATEEIAIRVGMALGGLINATLGNAVELIVAIIALTKCELEIVQSSLLGSILSNLLLVLGCCFLAAGLRFSEVGFGRMSVQTNYSLLVMSVIAILIPAGFHAAFDSTISDNIEAVDLLKMSRGIAVILLFIYGAYLTFTLYTHAHFFDDQHAESNLEIRRGIHVWKDHRVFKEARSARLQLQSPKHKKTHLEQNNNGANTRIMNGEKPLTSQLSAEPEPIENHTTSASDTTTIENAPTNTTTNQTALHPNDTAIEITPPDDGAAIPSSSSDLLGTTRKRLNTTNNETNTHNKEAGDLESQARDDNSDVVSDDEEEEETPTINLVSAIVCLIVVTVLVGVTAEWLVDSINGLTASGAISQEWVGLILLPIVGNAAEHVTAVAVATHDKLDLSLSVAVGSSIQIALFVIPLLIVIGWGMDKPLSLLFNPFESIVLFLTVMIVQATLQDNRANWLEGLILALVYVIIALVFWWYPQNSPTSQLFHC